MNERLSHWAAEPVAVAPCHYFQHREYKPNGLWFDVDEDWQRWCDGENFDVEGRAVQHEVRILEPSRVLVLDSVPRLDRFTEKFGVPPWYRKKPSRDDYDPRHCAIDWPAVAAEYGGIIIAPYQWERRLDLMWYYGWDCASGCVWDTSIIAVEAVARCALKIRTAG